MAEVDEFGVRKGDPHSPGLQHRIVVEALFIEGVVEPHHQVSESEFAGSLADSGPALVHSLRSGERILENVEVHLGLQHFAEVAGVEQPAEDSNFRVSQAMNAQPHESAENDNHCLGDVGIHDRQRAESRKRAASIQDQHCRARL